MKAAWPIRILGKKNPSPARRPNMDQHSDKLMIVGIDTLAGSNVALTLGDRCEIVGLSHHRSFTLQGSRTLIDRCRKVPGNSLSTDHIAASIIAEQPQWVIYCGPISYSSWDWGANSELDRPECTADHAVKETKRLTAALQSSQQCGAHLTLVSTDAICTGPQVFHDEETPVASAAADRIANRAANEAWQLERELHKHQALIVRTHLYGWSALGENYVEQLWLALEDGFSLNTSIMPQLTNQQTVSGSNYASPILASDFAELLWAALQRNLNGLYHAGGAERASQWQFATSLAAASGMWMNGGQIINKQSAIVPPMANQETSLDSRKLQRTLKLPLPRLYEGLERFTQQATSGYRNALRAAYFPHIMESAAA
jgi:dTDP-4-dehydrorhamnose reductase